MSIKVVPNEDKEKVQFKSGSLVQHVRDKYIVVVTKNYHPNFRGCVVAKSGLDEETVFSQANFTQWFGSITFTQE